MSQSSNTIPRIFESSAARARREEGEARDARASLERAQQLARGRASYAALKEVEAKLAAVADVVTPATDYQALDRATGELAALRRVLASFPEDVRVSYRAPETSGERSRWETRERHQAVATALAKELERIEQHELPLLEAKLASNDPLTAREFGAWAGYADPRERHFNLLREQSAAKQARIAECRALIAQADEKAARAE